MSNSLNNKNKLERCSVLPIIGLFLLCSLLVGFLVFSCLGFCLLLGVDLGEFSNNTLLKNISYVCFSIVVVIAIIKALVIHLRRGV